jgi:hypothetical protein
VEDDAVRPSDASSSSEPGGPTCAADLRVDPENCGACGLRCGGTCADGGCEPIVVADGLDKLVDIAGTADRVAWLGCTTNDAGVCNPELSSRPVDSDAVLEQSLGGLAVRALASGGSSFLLVADMGGAGMASRCTAGASSGSCATIMTQLGLPYRVAGDSSSAYALAAPGLVSCEAAACGNAYQVVLDPTYGPFLKIAVAGPYIYWVTGGANGKVRRIVRSARANADGGTLIEDLATGQLNPTSIAIDTTGVVWTETDRGRVLFCPTSGCSGSPSVVWDDVGSGPSAIVSDGSHLYFIVATRHQVASCPAGGVACSSPVVMLDNLDDPTALAIAGNLLIVADPGARRVLAVSR